MKNIELINKLSDKKVILLGESAHGVKEQNQNRVEIIKRLHKDMGDSVLCIELVKPSKHLNLYPSASQFIKNELHEVYHTDEILDLISFAYKNKFELRGFEIYDQYLEQYFHIKNQSLNNGFDSRTYRDLKMFEIFRQSFDEDKDKVIIWGHNAHMSKKASPAAYREKVFGEYIFETYGSIAHSIG